MIRSAVPDRVLVWMRDHRMAGELCAAFEARGLQATWAAALPEAISAVDRDFPAAIVCTLFGHSPSLIDIETLVAYQAIGHAFASLPSPPVWALTDDASAYAPDIAMLELPVQLIPQESGVEALIERVTGHLEQSGPACVVPGSTVPLVLFERPGEGAFVARYLGARGVRAHAVQDPEAALAHLARHESTLLVCEDFTLRHASASALWGWLSGPGLATRVILIGADDEWLSSVSPLGLPENIVCVLARPIRATALEATMRRLLRIAVREPLHSAGEREALLHG